MKNIMEQHRLAIEDLIMSFVPVTEKSYKLIEDAMKYSLEAGGKRVRPVLTMEFARVCGGNPASAVPFAAAVEFIHTYSLIHDDLPCMDNDDMRRGKPASHIKFGEANALLAGDALLTHAFSCIAESGLKSEQIARAVKELAYYAGANGMIGGQVVDLAGENKKLDIEELFVMDKLKTAALIKSACVLGCIAAESYENISVAVEFSENLGLAFQIIDDILDFLEGENNSDIVSGKSTYVSLLGIEKAKQLADKYTNDALNALDKFNGDTENLRNFTVNLLNRQA